MPKDAGRREAGRSALARYRLLRSRRRRRVAAALTFLVAAGLVAVSGGTGSGFVGPGRSLVIAFLGGAGAVVLVSGLAGPDARDLGRWRRGAAGEQLTAGILDALPTRRWAVWHDLPVPWSRANIDHVVVGRTGVWVVDTKATRGEITSGWRSVRLGGRRLDTGPTRWEAEVLAGELAARLGVAPPVVRPIVAVHGPQGESSPGLRIRGVLTGGVRVVPASALATRVRRGRRRLERGRFRAVCQAVDALAVRDWTL